MSNPILSIKNLSKHFGSIKAVDHLDLTVEKGQVFGILGPNGSGKTTTLGIILGAIAPKEGSYEWFGMPPSAAIRRRIGSILETPLFYPYLSAIDNLKIIADLKELPYTSIDESLQRVGLYERRKSKFSTYSLGMKQRLAVAAALLGNPEVMILDEPTNGLDPQGIAEIRNLIKKVSSEGTTIILASHLLDEVQKTCSHLAVMRSGRCLFTGQVDVMLHKGLTVELMADDKTALLRVLEQCPLISDLDAQTQPWKVKLNEGNDATQLHSFLISNGIVLNHLAAEKKSLEEQFLEILNHE